MLLQGWTKVEDAQVVVKWLARAIEATQAISSSFCACIFVCDIVVHGCCSQVMTHPNCWIEEVTFRVIYARVSRAIEIFCADCQRIAYVRVVDHLYLHLVTVVNDFFYPSRKKYLKESSGIHLKVMFLPEGTLIADLMPWNWSPKYSQQGKISFMCSISILLWTIRSSSHTIAKRTKHSTTRERKNPVLIDWRVRERSDVRDRASSTWNSRAVC